MNNFFFLGNPFLFYAALAGTCGALSAACIKIGVSAFSTSIIQLFVNTVVQEIPTWIVSEQIKGEFSENSFFYAECAIRIFIYALNGFFTAQMWRFFLKSMALGPVPIAQVVNTAVNFAVSAFVGVVLFGEVVGQLWFAGAIIAAIGLGLLVTETQ